MDSSAGDDAGGGIKIGDPNVMVIPTYAMMLPSGVTSFDDIEIIGHKQAMPINKINELYPGKNVTEEPNLKDVKKLTTNSDTGEFLKGHAMVYEVFTKDGRHVIAAKPNGIR